jgi:hypothetical protein
MNARRRPRPPFRRGFLDRRWSDASTDDRDNRRAMTQETNAVEFPEICHGGAHLIEYASRANAAAPPEPGECRFFLACRSEEKGDP